MSKRVFISFDYDHDADLKLLLVGQSKNADSPFEITDASVKEHLVGDWKDKVKGRINRADLVVVLCGLKTNSAAGVGIELEIARGLAKPYFLLAGRASGTNVKPSTALAADKLYDWTWPNLKALVGGGR